MPVSTFAEVATRSPASRTGFCTRCDAPRYADEEVCRYCGGPDRPRHVPWDALVMVAGGLLLLVLAAAAFAGPRLSGGDVPVPPHSAKATP